MKLATVSICKEKDPKTRKRVNAADYASDLGKARYKGWRLVSERRGSKKLQATEDARAHGIPGKISKEELDVLPKAKTPEQKVKAKEVEQAEVQTFDSPEEKEG